MDELTKQRQSLPVYQWKSDFARAVTENQIVMVVGETGSGKSTQLPQYLAEFGFGSRGKIGCTQPRRVAAVSLAQRVAKEYGCQVGEEVGYTIRFEDKVGADTLIKYMTDGILLRECLIDRDLSHYSVIMLDEAHERTMNTDVLFALLKSIVKRRPNLNLIISSATLDETKYSRYFYDAPVLNIPGINFPVNVIHTGDTEMSYMHSAIRLVREIHEREPPGDILVFLTGEEDINFVWEGLEAVQCSNAACEMVVYPIYSALPMEVQNRIFEKTPGKRKVIVATNIAETSITVDGIYYVIDCGLVKQRVYNWKTGIDSLNVIKISKASAKQRKGRAGRTGPGKCYRLYSQIAYDCMPEWSKPEIQRFKVSTVVLMLSSLNINVMNYNFMDQPPVESIQAALSELRMFSAIDCHGTITELGKRIVEFPLEPEQAKILIKSADLRCSADIIKILAMLSIRNVFYRPKRNKSIADETIKRFRRSEGDFITFLEVYNQCERYNFSEDWCKANFVQFRQIYEASEIKKQLTELMEKNKLNVVSGGGTMSIRHALCAGFFQNVAKRDGRSNAYRTLVDEQTVFIHPTSVLFQPRPQWVLYRDITYTKKNFMRDLTEIDPSWLIQESPEFFRSLDRGKLARFELSHLV